jgi:enoyl-CoA hydratase/carnithine racemase
MAIVDVTRADGVAEVLFNRPDRKNALSEEMFDAITAAGESLSNAPGLRAVVLRGAGGDFCAGLDTAFMGAMAGRIESLRALMLNPGESDGYAGPANWFQRPAYVWQELPVPVIAAIDGVCLGGGLQIALAADFRIAGPKARFSIMEARWGLIPDMGISQNLPKLMPADRAKMLMMQANMISSISALQAGLITELSEAPLERARELAKDLADKSPDAIRGIKRLVDQVWTLPEGEGLAVEAALQAPIIGGPNQVEAVMARMEERTPKFSDAE